MGESERLKLERKILGELCREECRLNYGQNLDGTEKDVDGWLLPALELNRVREERREIAKTLIDFYTRDETDEAWQIQSSDIRFVRLLPFQFRVFIIHHLFQPLDSKRARSAAIAIIDPLS